MIVCLYFLGEKQCFPLFASLSCFFPLFVIYACFPSFTPLSAHCNGAHVVNVDFRIKLQWLGLPTCPLSTKVNT